MSKVIIALDAMGGDHGPSVVVPAACDVLKDDPNVEIILVGDESIIAKFIETLGFKDNPRLRILHAPQFVTMDESPALALRHKRQSSMRLAINLVKTGEAHACVSAGNTGALMAIAKFVLKTIPGIDRPAIIYTLPTARGDDDKAFTRMLDLGANVDCDAEHLCQFAVMGSILTAAVEGIERPRVGLLNIGSEAIKGRESVKQAAATLMKLNTINYIGYVEGNGIFHDAADVIVCDGFVGNVALKTSEGVAKVMLSSVRRGFMRNWYTKFVALLAKPIFKQISKRYDPSGYNGASLLGLNGIVIKSHGNAERKGFSHAIREAICEAKSNIPEKIRTEIASHIESLELSK